MGSKLGWLPVDGASGDFLIQESHPLQGCVQSFAIVCSLLPPNLPFFSNRRREDRAWAQTTNLYLLNRGKGRSRALARTAIAAAIYKCFLIKISVPLNRNFS